MMIIDQHDDDDNTENDIDNDVPENAAAAAAAPTGYPDLCHVQIPSVPQHMQQGQKTIVFTKSPFFLFEVTLFPAG